MTRAVAGAAWITLMVLSVAACGQAGPTPPSLPSAGVSMPVASVPVPAATATPGAAQATEAPTAGATPAPAVEEDEGLLAVLPEAIEGTAVEREAQAFTESSRQPDFAASVGSAVFFVAPGQADLVSGLVAKPRDGIYSDAWFRDWRETYDDGACEQAGGVGGRAEAELAGRTVHITTCAGGMRVYHAWVEEQGVVVSLIALGDNRWGEKAMASLRP